MNAPTDTTIDERRVSFVAGLRALADHYEATPDLPLPYNVRFPSEYGLFNHYAIDAEDFTAMVRALGGKRDIQRDDDSVRAVREFGHGVTVHVSVARGEVCEARIVGTKTTVATALACVHCSKPIRLTDTVVWVHVDAEQGDYEGCDGTTSYEDAPDYDLVGEIATPPDFGAVKTKTTDVVEYDCKPILADPEAATS